MNKDKLVKLLNLTTSTNDHEAISAIRKANDLLRELGYTWDQIVNPKKDIITPQLKPDVRFTSEDFLQFSSRVDRLYQKKESLDLEELTVVARAAAALANRRKLSKTIVAQINILYERYI